MFYRTDLQIPVTQMRTISVIKFFLSVSTANSEDLFFILFIDLPPLYIDLPP